MEIRFAEVADAEAIERIRIGGWQAAYRRIYPTLWVLEENRRARGFYERAGWCSDNARKPFEHGGVSPLAIRYRKRPSSSASRS